MNKIEKIILVIALLVIIGGIIIYNINGIKYSENSMKLGDILTPYFIPELISLVLICVYFISICNWNSTINIEYIYTM